MLKPDYNNCILNIISSIKKYYNKDYTYPSNSLLDKELNEFKPKHIILMLLDGLGSNILDIHKDVALFLNDNKICDISSVFPSTTSAAIPACVSGKAPIETGWLGWENYIKEIDKNVVFFKNTDYLTNEKLDFNVLDIFPYKSFSNDLGINTFSIGPSFYADGCKTFKKFIDKAIKITINNNESFTYAYWDDPDYNLHEFGTKSIKVNKSLKNIDKNLIRLSKKIKDTLVIVTADHGHIDSSPIYFRHYSDLYNMLNKMPSNEARCTFYDVKKEFKDDFFKLFNDYFGDKFILMTKEDFLSQEFLGLKKYSKKHERIDELIGDFVSIGIDKYYFNYTDINEPDFIFKSHHAGLTKEELNIPLIIYKKR